MGAAGGPNMVEDGMVFYYDTGNATRSYKGKPTSNLLETDANWLYVGNTITDPSNYPVALPRNVKFSTGGSNNGISWTDACKNFTDSYSAGTQITVSGWHMFYSTDTSLSMNSRDRLGWHYNKDGTSTYGGTIHTATEWNKWYYFSNTFSSTGVTTTLRVEDGGADYYRSSEDAAQTTQYYCNLQREIGDGIVSPYVKGARSVSGSLLDMTGNSTINLTNVSFDSNAQMTFDGTNDDINIGPGTSTSFQRTIEMVFKTNTLGYLYPLAAYTRGGGQSVVGGKRMWLGFQNNKFQMHGWGTSDPASTTTIQTGQYYHAVYAYDQSTKKHYIWINGVLENNSTNDQSGFTGWSASGDHNWFVGGDPDCASWTASAGRSLNGDIPIFKVYDRILSTEEVKNNFNGIKKRFGI